MINANSVQSASLQDVYKVAKLTADNVVSIGSSLAHVHVPGRDVSEGGEQELAFNEIEIGMGESRREGELQVPD